MDRETQEEFLVVIQAKDMGGHMGGLSGSTTVTVTLSDVNDNPPKFPQSKGGSSVPKQSFNVLPTDPGERKYWGREEDWRLLLRTHLPSSFP
jgi:hypothetical protein